MNLLFRKTGCILVLNQKIVFLAVTLAQNLNQSYYFW